MKKCYNCGIELTKENTTGEHIPAQNIFTSYPENYKNNRLVVPVCFECNNKYSKIDQEIRDALGIMNDNNVQQNELIFTENTRAEMGTTAFPITLTAPRGIYFFRQFRIILSRVFPS